MKLHRIAYLYNWLIYKPILFLQQVLSGFKGAVWEKLAFFFENQPSSTYATLEGLPYKPWLHNSWNPLFKQPSQSRFAYGGN